MIDRNIILSKASAVKRHLSRIEVKSETDLKTFLKDIDRQESILFNLQMAIQMADQSARILRVSSLPQAPYSASHQFIEQPL